MWKNRLFGGVVLATVLAATALLAASATATPTRKQETVKLGFITKFPVDFFFTLENAAKKWWWNSDELRSVAEASLGAVRARGVPA